MKRALLIAAGLVLAVVTGCPQPPQGAPAPLDPGRSQPGADTGREPTAVSALQPGPPPSPAGSLVLAGQIDWLTTPTTLAVPGDISMRATVNLIDLTRQETIGTTISDAVGNFGLGIFTIPAAGHGYILEAVKGMDNHAAGKDAIRLRTPIFFDRGDWRTPGSDAGIRINYSTTALAIALSHRAGTAAPLDVRDIVGSLRVGEPQPEPSPGTPDTYTPPATGGISLQEFHDLWGMVAEAVTGDHDPVQGIQLETQTLGFRYAPDVHRVNSAAAEPAVAGDVVTIGGEFFEITRPDANLARFNGAAGTTLSATKNSLQVTVPPDGTSGEISVQIGRFLSFGPYFKIKPTVRALSPAAGSVTGADMTVDGTGFPAKGLAAYLNGLTLPIRQQSATRIVATLPDDAITGDLVVSTPEFQVSGGAYPVLPTIAGLDVTKGPTGASVTLDGTGFHAYLADKSRVTFGGVEAPLTSWANRRIVAQVPETAMSGPVAVTTSYGQSAGLGFTVLPTLRLLSPAVATAGTVVTLTGTGFHDLVSGESKVNWGGLEIDTFEGWTNSEIKLKVPDLGTSCQVSVITPHGSTGGQDFAIMPVISKVEPASAKAGSAVTITGTGFEPYKPGTSQVNFGTVPAPEITSWSATRIVAIVPADAVSGEITVQTNAPGQPTSAGMPFAMLPALSGVSPGSALTGTAVTLTGTGFDPFKPGVSQVYFGGVPATEIRSWTHRQVVATVPEDGLTGEVTVKTAAAGEPVSNGRPFSVLPAISSLTPGAAAAGQTITLKGTGFGTQSAGMSQVFFGTVAAARIESWANREIKAVVPDAAVSGDVTVRTAAPGEPVSAGRAFAMLPTLGSIAPDKEATGKTITLTGTGFDPYVAGKSQVVFGGSTTGDITAWSPTRIVAVIPASATTGKATVKTGAGGNPESNSLDLAILPTITGLSSTRVAPGETVTISGTGLHAFVSGTSKITFTGAGGPSAVSAPARWSNDRVEVAVPLDAVTGDLTATTAYGTSNAVLLRIKPLLSSLDVSYAVTGQTVTLTGLAFGASQGTSKVYFNGLEAASYNSWSNTRIQAVVPDDATTGDVTVMTTEGLSAGSGLKISPTIRSISVSSGVAGTDVTIDGTGFHSYASATSTARFAGVDASNISQWDNRRIVARVPSQAITGALTASTAYGTADGGTFTVLPLLSSLDVTDGPTGTRVTLSGAGFHSYSAANSAVTFGGVAATAITRWDNNTIVADVPADANTGPVKVKTRYGTSGGLNFVVKPTITALGATSATTGSTIAISGTAFGSFVTGISKVYFNGVDAGAVSNNWFNRSLSVVVPAGATTGNVTVVTPDGTSNGIPFTVLPTISGLGVTSGPAGTDVTITGTGFHSYSSASSKVRFNGYDASAISEWTNTRIVARVPDSATTGAVTITTAYGTAAGPTFSVSPAIGSLSASSGTTGARVTISGSGFHSYSSSSSAVYFSGIAASIADWANGAITVDVPAAATTGPITVKTAYGTSAGAHFAVLPSISSLGSTIGGRGSSVTISGTGFGSFVSGRSKVYFNGVEAAVGSWSSTAIAATVPDTATTGDVVVSTADGDSGGVGYTVLVDPEISSLSASSGTTGTDVTIDGSIFLGYNPATSKVRFNGYDAYIASWTDTRIVARVPANATTGTLTVITAYGSGSGGNFTVLPAIGSLGATSGTTGTQITIGGTGFHSFVSGTSAVTFNGTAASIADWKNDAIKVNVPADATSGQVQVKTQYGTSAGIGFTVKPTVTALSVSSGTQGTTVTISGTGLGSFASGTTKVTFGGADAGVTAGNWSNRSITATVPAAAITGDVGVIASGGSASYSSFMVLPVLSGQDVTSGPTGTRVTLSGAGFHSYSAANSAVTFGGEAATNIISWGNNTIVADVPADANTGLVKVKTPYGTSGGLNFTVKPAISALGSTSATTGSTIAISGTAFGSFVSGSSKVYFNGVDAGVVSTNWYNRSITAVVPAGATSGNITVVTPGGTSNGVPFSVLPAISSLGTTSGPTGTDVTITGTGLHSFVSGSSKVKFGGVDAGTITSWSNTSIVARVPSGATTGAVSVTTQYGTSGGLTFTVLPAIGSVSASGGTTGTRITISGSGFHSYSSSSCAVYFNGTAATSIPTWSNDTITVDVPSDATSGQVTVKTAYGTSAGVNFAVKPAISSLGSASGTRGSSVTISGTGFGSFVSGKSKVYFNGVDAGVGSGSWSNKSITAAVPGTATTGDVVVATADGNSGGVRYTVLVDPVVSKVWTTSGTTGTDVTIDGSIFLGYSSSTSKIRFNGVDASYIPTWNDSRIIARVPGTATTGTITIATAYGSTSAGTFTVLPAISSLGATSGTTGTRITISGSGFHSYSSSTCAVYFNGTAATSIPSWSNDTITVDVPSDATSGQVTVKTPHGTSAGVSFAVKPALSSLDTSSGVTGTSVTISGTGFDSFVSGSSKVYFNGTDTGVSSGNWSNKSITAVVPAGATTGNVVVATAAGTSAGLTFSVKPAISSLGTTSGTTGTDVTITGTGFHSFLSGSSKVRFNGYDASAISEWGNTKIVARVPSGATTGAVTVITAYGTANGSNFSVLPAISSLGATSGTTGTRITISGTGFHSFVTGQSAVTFNGTAASYFETWGNDTIKVDVPADATSGEVKVKTSYGTSTGVSFTVKPSISSLSVSSGTTGTTVTISGSGFGSFSSGTSKVTFGGVDAGVTSGNWSNRSITATVPSTAVTGDVVVTASGGSANYYSSFTVTPSISSLSHSSATTGTTVTINGSGFGSSRGTVYFNGVAASGYGTWTVTKVEATIPSDTNSGNVTVKTADGTSNGVNLTITPSISSLDPASAKPGDWIKVKGSGFGSRGSSRVTFNGGDAASYGTWTTNWVEVKVPESVLSGSLTLSTSAGTSNGSTFWSVPRLDSVSPTSATVVWYYDPVWGRWVGSPNPTTVTLTGAGFDPSNQSTKIVYFGSTAGQVTSWSPTSIQAYVPKAQSGTVKVQSQGGTSNTQPFTTYLIPNLYNMSPGGSSSSRPLVKNGNNNTRLQVSGIDFGPNPSVTVAGKACSIISWQNDWIDMWVPPSVPGRQRKGRSYVPYRTYLCINNGGLSRCFYIYVW